MHYVYLLLAWGVYFFLHSVLATSQVKAAVLKLMGNAGRWYRLFYSIMASIGLLVVLVYGAALEQQWLLPREQGLKVLGMIIAFYGIIVVKRTFKYYSFKRFVGVDPEDGAGATPLQTEGLLSYVRHPMYSGTILLFIGFCCFAPSVVNVISLGMVVGYILIAIRWEEQKLVASYGVAYENYREKVPALIPFKGKAI